MKKDLNGGLINKMNIKNIKTLTMNPHFYSILLQSFLTGYNKPCDLKTAFIALTILFNAESRDKLNKSNKKSRIGTLFGDDVNFYDENISRKTSFSNFVDKYNYLQPYFKKAFIILCSEEKASFVSNEIILKKGIDYKKYNDEVRDWLKCSFYLGVIFDKENRNHLFSYIGVKE